MRAGSSNGRMIGALGSDLVDECFSLEVVPIAEFKTVFSASGG